MARSTGLLVICAALAITGCNRSVNALDVGAQPPQALPSVPSGQVQSTELEPVSTPNNTTAYPQETQPVTAPTSTELNQDTNSTIQQAGLETPTGTSATASAEPLTHEMLQGNWKVASDSSSCKVFLPLTRWNGSYRAGSKHCTNPEIGQLSGWDVKGKQVVLLDSGGNRIATLYSSGPERFNGQTASGKPITFFR